MPEELEESDPEELDPEELDPEEPESGVGLTAPPPPPPQAAKISGSVIAVVYVTILRSILIKDIGSNNLDLLLILLDTELYMLSNLMDGSNLFIFFHSRL